MALKPFPCGLMSCSILTGKSILSMNSFNCFLACSEKAFSRPFKTTWILTLLFLSRNFFACSALKVKSPIPVLGLNRIPFNLVFFWVFLPSSFRLVSKYWNLPQSIILQTGGSAFGAISTKSKPTDLAKIKASLISKIPCCSPLSPTTRTMGALIDSLVLLLGFWGTGLNTLLMALI